uniref:Secreted protein n=1 Tax=Psorophora albipes TaxID=869069 RepID=T1DG29_9DIPT
MFSFMFSLFPCFLFILYFFLFADSIPVFVSSSDFCVCFYVCYDISFYFCHSFLFYMSHCFCFTFFLFSVL